MSRFPANIGWPGSQHVPDLRRAPQFAAIAALCAAAGIVVHALIAAHPEFDRPGRHTERTALAWGVLHSIDQLLIIVAHYEQAILDAPRRATARTAANDEKGWEQLALPFPNWPAPAAHERARGAAIEGAR